MMTDQGDHAATMPSTASVGTSSTALMGAIEGVRRLVVTAIVLVLIVGVGLGAALLVTRNDLAAANDRIAALTQVAQAGAQAQAQPAESGQQGQQPPIEVSAAQPLEGVDQLPSAADASGALLVGNPNASNVVELFVDFQCPFCQRWETEYGDALATQATKADGDVLLKLYPLAFLKETDVLANPGASARAANAAACIADTGDATVLLEFTKTVYANADPTEPDGQFPTEQLVEFAQQSGASDQAVACIEDQTFIPYVQAVTQGSFKRGVSGTPTLVINGDAAENSFTDERLTALLRR